MAKKQEEAAPESEPRLVVKERKVDRFTVKREKVIVKPTMCDVCGADLLDANAHRFSEEEFDRLPDDERAIVVRLVKEHKRAYHPEPLES